MNLPSIYHEFTVFTMNLPSLPSIYRIFTINLPALPSIDRLFTINLSSSYHPLPVYLLQSTPPGPWTVNDETKYNYRHIYGPG